MAIANWFADNAPSGGIVKPGTYAPAALTNDGGSPQYGPQPGEVPATTMPMPWQQGGLSALGGASTAGRMQPARIGEQRMVKGQLAQWDGQAWRAL